LNRSEKNKVLAKVLIYLSKLNLWLSRNLKAKEETSLLDKCFREIGHVLTAEQRFRSFRSSHLPIDLSIAEIVTQNEEVNSDAKQIPAARRVFVLVIKSPSP